jgi:branched-chain amino acid transport system substrate-binding protein
MSLHALPLAFHNRRNAMCCNETIATPSIVYPPKLPRALVRLLVGALTIFGAEMACAQETIRIGVSVPITGPFAVYGKQMQNALKLFIERNGSTVAGRKIEVIVRDDAGVPDQAKRVAQELVVNEKVAILAGYLPTPTALAVAPIATEAQIPLVAMGIASSIITERSPYIVRTFFTLPQVTVPMAQWAIKNGIKRVVTLVSDYTPGLEAEKAFIDEFKAGGGEIVQSLRVPLQSPDFAPFLQRARDAKPEALFVWVPGSQAPPLLRQFGERGMQTAGIKLIGPGDITDDDGLNEMGDSTLGITTSFQYSAAHPSAINKAFVEGFRRVSGGLRPDQVAVSAYDGMHLIYEALKTTAGDPDGKAIVAAMKGMAWESARGPISIDPDTRDIIQNVYIRRVERVDGELYNVELDKYEAVKDPIKAAQK